MVHNVILHCRVTRQADVRFISEMVVLAFVGQFLLNQRKQFMNQTQELKDALFEAAKSGNLDQVQQLVESGADINAVDEHHITPFLWAYFGGHTEVVKYLLSEGGNINHDEFSEGTLLTFAAFTGDVAFIPYLLDAGAEIDHAMPRGGETALHHAADNDQTAAIRLLIQHGADVNH